MSPPSPRHILFDSEVLRSGRNTEVRHSISNQCFCVVIPRIGVSFSIKPFVINGTDISFLREQVRFRPLFDANHNAIINWDGATAIYNGYGVLLYTPPVGQTAGSVGALAAIDTWGTSYQTVVDLSGIRDPSGANNNLAGVLWQYGNTNSLFHRLAAPDYSNYAVAPDGKVNGGLYKKFNKSRDMLEVC